MRGLKEIIVRTAKEMFRYAAFGVALCVGTTILLYQMILEWLHPARSLPSNGDEYNEKDEELASQDPSTKKLKSSSVDKESSQWRELHAQSRDDHSSNVSHSCASAEGLRHRHRAMNTTDCRQHQLNIDDASTLSFHDSNLSDVSSSVKEFEAQETSGLNNNTQDSLVTPSAAEMRPGGASRYRANLENWSFSLNTEHSRSNLHDYSLTSSADQDDSEAQCPSTIVRKRGETQSRSHTKLQGFQEFLDHDFSFASSAFSPGVLSYQHSTPDDQQTTVALTSRSERTTTESLFTPVNDHKVFFGDSNDKSFVMNTISLHDFSARELRRSRSCASLDDSIFLMNDLALFDTPCGNDICTAVTSMEQLEREVAGVISDCGEMQRHFGLLRRHDRRDKVAKRYSLGVADSVIASDSRLFGMSNHHDMSLIAEAQNLSGSIGNGRDSGYIWDDDLLEIELAPNRSKRRASRSFSLPRSF